MLRRFWEQVRRKAWPPNWRWVALLVANPTMFLTLIFFINWLNVPDVVVDAYLGYSVLLIVFLIWRMIRSPLAQLVPALAFLASASLSFATYPFISGFGFYLSIYPQSSFLKNHCRTTTFLEDHKTYEIGLCDVTLVEGGQFDDFSCMYDTSGNAGIDEDVKEARNSKDRKEWVDAIRKVMKNDPNDQFEHTNFYSDKLWGDFYYISFEPGISTLGFTGEYGPPPHDVHNPYPPIF